MMKACLPTNNQRKGGYGEKESVRSVTNLVTGALVLCQDKDLRIIRGYFGSDQGATIEYSRSRWPLGYDLEATMRMVPKIPWIIRSILTPLIRIEKKFRSRKNQKTSLTIRRMLTPLVNKGEKKDKMDWIWCVLALQQ